MNRELRFVAAMETNGNCGFSLQADGIKQFWLVLSGRGERNSKLSKRRVVFYGLCPTEEADKNGMRIDADVIPDRS